MEIGRIGQGGQKSFDNTVTKSEAPKAEQVPLNVKVQPEDSSKSVKDEKKDEPIDEKELKDAIDKLSKFIGEDNTKIEYPYHKTFNDLMIKIVNKSTNEVILEVPPRKILDLVAKMMEMVGLLFDKKA